MRSRPGSRSARGVRDPRAAAIDASADAADPKLGAPRDRPAWRLGGLGGAARARARGWVPAGQRVDRR